MRQDNTSEQITNLPARLLANKAFLLSRLGNEARRRFVQVLAAWQITQAHFSIMNVLEELHGASQQEVAQILNIDRANLVALIDHLEAKGWVTRTRDASDRRRYALQLTAQGEQTLHAILQVIDQLNQDFFGGLDDVEQATLHALLRKVFATAVGAPNETYTHFQG